jgi:uncharacterized membrane protein HdeD (DUF308 family)
MVQRGSDRLNLLKQPGWLRALEIVTGLLAMLLGVLVLVFPGWGVSTLVVLLGIGLFFSGMRSISLLGFGSLPNILKAVSAVAGIISLILGLLVAIFPGFGVLTLLLLVSYGLIIYGFSRIYIAYALKAVVSWIRGIIVVVGVLDIILSIVVIVLPGLALLTIAVIISIVLLVSGLEMVVSGAIGRTWLGEFVKAATDEMGES